MENNLDKYFKDNLHDRRFEVKEEHWLGAEKLLDEQERRRRRRGLFWWFGGGLAVLALVALGGWLLGKNGGERPAENPAGVAAQTQAGGREASPVFGKKNETKPIGQSAENGLDEGAATPFPEGENRKSKATPATQESSSHLLKSSSRQVSGQAPKPIGGPVTAENGSPEIAQQPTSSAQQQALILPKAAPETGPFGRQLSPDFLALLPAFVTGGFGQKNLATNAKIEVARPRKLHLGLMASQLLNARPDSGEQARIGFRAGLVLRYDLPGNWYLASGLQYQRRSGHFEDSEQATAKRFSFGVQEETLALRPNSLHYLSVPALIGWERNRHQLEAGLLLDYLTGAHGETGSYQQAGEPPMKVFARDKSGWVAEDGYRRFAPTAQLGYRFRMNGQWSLGLTANYTLGGILDKNFEPPLGGSLLKESDKFHLGLQAVYFIK